MALRQAIPAILLNIFLFSFPHFIHKMWKTFGKLVDNVWILNFFVSFSQKLSQFPMFIKLSTLIKDCFNSYFDIKYNRVYVRLGV